MCGGAVKDTLSFDTDPVSDRLLYHYAGVVAIAAALIRNGVRQHTSNVLAFLLERPCPWKYNIHQFSQADFPQASLPDVTTSLGSHVHHHCTNAQIVKQKPWVLAQQWQNAWTALV